MPTVIGTMRSEPDVRLLPNAPGALLLALQLGDSFFPSGGSAFSWGLESMQCDGMVSSAEQVFGAMSGLVEQRWAGFDRPLLRAAHAASWRPHPSAGPSPIDRIDDGPANAAITPFDALIALDELCEAMSLNAGARSASRRLGFTQLRVHGELGLANAAGYLQVVRAGRAIGHLPVAQGLVWASLGLSIEDTEAMSAFSLCTAVAGAAIRMGVLGHIDAQKLLMRMRARIAAVLDTPAPDLDAMWTGAPALDIAALRHEPRAARLFAN